MVSWLHSSLNNDFPISLSISRGTVFCREHYIRDRHDTHESVQWLIFDVVKKYIELAIRLPIYFVEIHGKKIYVENAKTTYNLE